MSEQPMVVWGSPDVLPSEAKIIMSVDHELDVFRPTEQEMDAIVISLVRSAITHGHPDGIEHEVLVSKVGTIVDQVTMARFLITSLRCVVDRDLDFWVDDDEEICWYPRSSSNRS